MALLLASAGAWSLVLSRWQHGFPAIPTAGLPHTPRPPLAVFTAVLWIVMLAAGRLSHEFHEEAPSLPDMTEVASSLALSVILWLSLLTTLLVGHEVPRECLGMTLENWPTQLGYAAWAYLASFLPTVVLMQALAPWRVDGTEHAYLRLLAESPDWRLVLLMFVAAAVVAPLSEELLFRVTLQGWLRERLGASRAIPITAVTFAVIHGWRDGLALLPLALILGYLFERRRSYLAVVAMHSLFNSVMFGLQWLGAGGRPE